MYPFYPPHPTTNQGPPKQLLNSEALLLVIMHHAGLNKHLKASFPVATESKEIEFNNSSLLRLRGAVLL